MVLPIKKKRRNQQDIHDHNHVVLVPSWMMLRVAGGKFDLIVSNTILINEIFAFGEHLTVTDDCSVKFHTSLRQ